MFKFLYVIYGGIVLVASTVVNLNYMSPSSSTGGSGWSSRSTGSTYGGGGSGYSGGGHHK
jgi:hypothetical protein